jgi:hypothetical protein
MSKKTGYKDVSKVGENLYVGIVAGDLTCLRTVVKHWTGKPLDSLLLPMNDVIYLSDKDNERELLFIFSSQFKLEVWPGGPLIWLFPERGPSELELIQFKLFLENNVPEEESLRIVLCLPHEVTINEVQELLKNVSETLCWAINQEYGISIEAVYLTTNMDYNIIKFLSELKERQ